MRRRPVALPWLLTGLVLTACHPAPPAAWPARAATVPGPPAVERCGGEVVVPARGEPPTVDFGACLSADARDAVATVLAVVRREASGGGPYAAYFTDDGIRVFSRRLGDDPYAYEVPAAAAEQRLALEHERRVESLAVTQVEVRRGAGATRVVAFVLHRHDRIARGLSAAEAELVDAPGGFRIRRLRRVTLAYRSYLVQRDYDAAYWNARDAEVAAARALPRREGRRALVRALGRAGRIDEALEILRAGAEDPDADRDWLTTLARFELRRGRFEAAEALQARLAVAPPGPIAGWLAATGAPEGETLTEHRIGNAPAEEATPLDAVAAVRRAEDTVLYVHRRGAPDWSPPVPVGEGLRLSDGALEDLDGSWPPELRFRYARTRSEGGRAVTEEGVGVCGRLAEAPACALLPEARHTARGRRSAWRVSFAHGEVAVARTEGRGRARTGIFPLDALFP
jgi:hypothetical protein